MQYIDRLEAEIERLQGLLENSGMTVAELLANDERLRAALKSIADREPIVGGDAYLMRADARRALEQKADDP